MRHGLLCFYSNSIIPRTISRIFIAVKSALLPHYLMTVVEIYCFIARMPGIFLLVVNNAIEQFVRGEEKITFPPWPTTQPSWFIDFRQPCAS